MGDECDKEVAYLTQLSVRPFNNEPDSLYTVHPIEDSWFETTYATAIEKSCVTLIPRSECKTAQTASANYLKSFLHSPTSLHLDSSSSTQILCERYKRECNRSEENFSSNPVGQQTIRSFNSNRSETNDNNKNEQFVRNEIAQNTNPKQKNKIYPSIFCCFRDSSLNRPTKESLIVDSKSTVNSKPPSDFAIRESTTNDESIVRDAHNTESEKMGRERCHEVTDADVVLRTSMDECSKSVRSSKWSSDLITHASYDTEMCSNDPSIEEMSLGVFHGFANTHRSMTEQIESSDEERVDEGNAVFGRKRIAINEGNKRSNNYRSSTTSEYCWETSTDISDEAIILKRGWHGKEVSDGLFTNDRSDLSQTRLNQGLQRREVQSESISGPSVVSELAVRRRSDWNMKEKVLCGAKTVLSLFMRGSIDM